VKKRNILLFIVILLMALAWGAVYWIFVAPNFGPPTS
jgi:hypothetical protein